MTIPTWKEYNEGIKFTNEKELKMPPLPYDPENAKGDSGKEFEPDQPGEYWFEVTKAEEKTSAAGNIYTALTMKVDTGNRSATVFTNIHYSEKALFIVGKFVECTGISFPTEHDHFIGARGQAYFGLNDKDYLEPKKYISGGSAAKDTADVQKVKQASSTPIEEIPF